MDDQQLEKRLDRIEKNIEDLIEIVVAVKDNMATKAELEEVKTTIVTDLETFKTDTANNFEIVNGKIDGIRRWMDIEVEERKKLEDRVSKVEEVVRP